MIFNITEDKTQNLPKITENIHNTEMLPDQPQGNISREMANLASLIPNDYKSIDVLKMLAFFLK